MWAGFKFRHCDGHYWTVPLGFFDDFLIDDLEVIIILLKSLPMAKSELLGKGNQAVCETLLVLAEFVICEDHLHQSPLQQV